MKKILAVVVVFLSMFMVSAAYACSSAAKAKNRCKGVTVSAPVPQHNGEVVIGL